MGTECWLDFPGMVCTKSAGIQGAVCKLIGDMGHGASATSHGPSGEFNCGGMFYCATEGEAVENLILQIETSLYYSEDNPWPAGSPNQPWSGVTYYMEPMPGPQGQSQSLDLTIEPQLLEFAALVNAKASAWVGKWSNVQFVESSQKPMVVLTIELEVHTRGVSTYAVGVEDNVFSQKFHQKGVVETTIRSIPWSRDRQLKRQLGSSGRHLAVPVPGIDVPRLIPRGSKTIHVQEWLKAQPLGVLTDALELKNGVTLELYGVHSGKNLVDYAVRYVRRLGPKDKPLLDLMLRQVIEIPK